MSPEIIIRDNHLSQIQIQDLENFLLSNEFPYYYNINIAGEDDDKTDTHMFNHRLMIKNKECSNVGKMITDIIMNGITHNNILRSKINLYLKTDSLKLHKFHKDTEQENTKIALFYINTNNGYTEFEDGTIVESVRNRLVLFPCNLKHRSTTTTDTRHRLNVNINYD